MMTLKSMLTLPAAGLSGFEPPMSEEETAVQESLHRFAKDVMRPLGAELDKMTAKEVIAPGSPYYGVFAEFAKLGIDPSMLADLPPDVAIRMESLIGEELGWGDA
jgi:acyl-CoA dehydrogenase